MSKNSAKQRAECLQEWLTIRKIKGKRVKVKRTKDIYDDRVQTIQ